MQRLARLHPPHKADRHRQLVPREIATPSPVRKRPYIPQHLNGQSTPLEDVDGSIRVEYPGGVAALDDENLRSQLLFFLCRSERGRVRRLRCHGVVVC